VNPFHSPASLDRFINSLPALNRLQPYETRLLHARLYKWLQFPVTLPITGKTTTFTPTPPHPLPSLNEGASVATEDFVLSERLDAQERSSAVRIDNKEYDDAISEFESLGTVEQWHFINTTNDAHPMHLHLVQPSHHRRLRLRSCGSANRLPHIRGACASARALRSRRGNHSKRSR